MYLYLLLGLGFLVGLYLSSGARREKLKAKWNLLRMLWGLINGTGSGSGLGSGASPMLGMMTPTSVPEISFSVCDTNRAAMIQYERLGQKYTYFAPFNRSYVVKMAAFKVELLRPQKEPLQITLQPGLAYRITAAELGGTGIRITNTDTGEQRVYGPDEEPGFGVELQE